MAFLYAANQARGLVKMTQGELEQIYTQKAVIIEFVSKPLKTSKITFVQCLINVAKSFRLSIFRNYVMVFVKFNRNALL